MQYSINIGIDLDESVGNVLGAALPRVSQAVRGLTQAVASKWQVSIQQSSLWSGEKDAYASSIKWRMKDDFNGEVESTYKYASEIEAGRPPRDLKQMLNTSMKVRVVQSGKNAGKRYLIIPFRHNTPGNNAHAKAMPQNVHAAAKMLSASSIVGQSQRQSGTGAMDTKTRSPVMVPRNHYQWGGRLPAGLAPKLKSNHATDPYAGMVRFQTNAPGSPKSSSYMTFRVMMEGSPKWIVPAKAGLKIAGGVVEAMKPVSQQVISQAIWSKT